MATNRSSAPPSSGGGPPSSRGSAVTGDEEETPAYRKSSPLLNALMIGLGLCCVLSVSSNVMHADTFSHNAPDTALSRHLKDFKRGRMKTFKDVEKSIEKMAAEEENEDETEEELIHNQAEDFEGQHEDMVDPQEIRHGSVETPPASTIGSLECTKYGGPVSKEAAEEMVYWHDIPSDQQFVSPMKKPGARRQYLTFEPDGGMFVSIRTMIARMLSVMLMLSFGCVVSLRCICGFKNICFSLNSPLSLSPTPALR